MIPRPFLAVSTVLALSTLTLALTGCASKPATTAKASPAKSSSKAAAPRANEFQQMIDVLELKGDQLAQFKAKWAERDRAVEQFSMSAEGRQLAALRAELSAAKSAKETAKVASLQSRIEPLSRKESGLRSAQRAFVMGTLTLQQQQNWAAHLLYGRVSGRLGVPRAELTAAQLKQLGALCQKIAADAVKAGTIAKDPYLNLVKELQPATIRQATEAVLTAAQRQKIAATAKSTTATPAKP